MTDRRVACPRCGQAWLVRVRLIHLSRDAILCPECDALWLRSEDVGSTPFEDYGTFMIRHGREEPENENEIAIEGDLLRDPSARG